MKALELRKWLDWNFDHDNIAEDADFVVELRGLECGYIYPKFPKVDEDGDITLEA